MSFAGEYELYGELLVVDDLGQTVQIGEEQVGALIGGEAAGKAYDQRIGIDAVENAEHGGGIALICEPFGLEFAFYEVDKFVFHCHSHIPYLFVVDGEDAFPRFRVGLVGEYLLAELLGVECFPFRCCPCRHVHAVCHVAHVALTPVVALPYSLEHAFRHFAVEPAHAVGFLTGVQREHAHGETFGRVGVLAAHVHEVLPADAEFCRVFAHVFAEETFVEIVVPGGYGGVDGVER